MSDLLKKVHAQIALQLTRRQIAAVGEPPGDEELAALSDGKLENTRRAQVMSHLAADEALYARFIALQSATAFVEGESESTQRSAMASHQPTFAERLRAWLRAPVFAGAITAMLVILLMPTLRPDYSREVDELYDNIAVSELDSRAIPESGQMDRPDPDKALALSTTRQLMEAGVRTGLEQVGLSQGLPGLSASGFEWLSLYNRIGLIQPSWRARYELGRLTALATLQCRADIAAADYAAILDQYQAVRAVLINVEGMSEYAALQYILAAFDQAGDARIQVCLAASRAGSFLGDRP